VDDAQATAEDLDALALLDEHAWEMNRQPFLLY
jgi:hypothetical protein